MGQQLLPADKVFIKKSLRKLDIFDEEDSLVAIMQQIPFFVWLSHGYVIPMSDTMPPYDDCAVNPLMENILKNLEDVFDAEDDFDLSISDEDDVLTMADKDLDIAAYDEADEFDPDGLECSFGQIVLTFPTSILIWSMAPQESQDEDTLMEGFLSEIKSDEPHPQLFIVTCQSQSPS